MASGRDFQLSDSYGAPQAPPQNYYNNPGYDSNYPDYGNPQRNPGSGGGLTSYNSNSYYVGYTSDLELCMKLGQVALIAFIILTIFLLAFLLFKCCLECRSLSAGQQPNFSKRTLNQRYEINLDFKKPIKPFSTFSFETEDEIDARGGPNNTSIKTSSTTSDDRRSLNRSLPYYELNPPTKVSKTPAALPTYAYSETQHNTTFESRIV